MHGTVVLTFCLYPSRYLKRFIFLVGFLLLVGCAGKPPLQPYVEAQEALRYAKRYGADGSFPKLFLEAKRIYKEGESFYHDRYYVKAKTSFEDAVRLAEKAETKARLKYFLEGDMIP